MQNARIPRVVVGLMLFATTVGGLAQAAHAADVTLTLTRLTLLATSDAAGVWQFAGGTATLTSTLVARWMAVRRTLTGVTGPQNAASVTLTLFLLGADPPGNLTLQGAHSFENGNETGGVSASSIPGATGITWTLLQSASSDISTLTFHVP